MLSASNIMGTAKRNIMVLPCMVKIWLYLSGPRKRFSGRASWIRISTARKPANTKKMKAVIMNRLPMIL